MALWTEKLQRACIPTSNQSCNPNMVADLYPYQIDAVNQALAREGRILLAHEMGLGKTVTALATMKHYRSSDWPLLILAPKAVLKQWEEEVRRWISQETRIRVIRNGKETFEADIEVVITTYGLFAKREHLRSKPGGGKWKSIIIDESHKIKNPSAKRTKAVLPVGMAATRCMLLSGTPMMSSAADLWPQLLLSMPRSAARYMPDFKTWEKYYCVESEIFTGYRTIQRWSSVKEECADDLNRILATVSLRVLKSEVASQLPPKIISKLYFEASSPTVRARVTKRMETFQNLNDLERFAIEADDEIERTPTYEVMKLFRENTLDRVRAAIDWVKETFVDADGSEKKLIIFAYHVEVMDKLAGRLQFINANFVRIDGRTSQRERDRRIDEFKTDSDCQIGLFSIASCGTGLNLTEATTILFAEMYWSRNLHAQAEDRIHRINQTEPCNIFYAMFSDSLDEIIYNKLQKTKRLTKAVVDGRATQRKRKRSHSV